MQRDDRLAALLADLAEQQRRGTAPGIDEAAQAHPDLAEELRALWATAQFAAAFAGPAGDMPTGPASSADPPPPDSFGDYEILGELGFGPDEIQTMATRGVI